MEAQLKVVSCPFCGEGCSADVVMCSDCEALPLCYKCEEPVHVEQQETYRDHTRHRGCVPRVLFMNVYSVERCYGGPEEGGWWYDAGTPLASVPFNPKADDKAQRRIRKRLEFQFSFAGAARSRYSVIGGPDVEVKIEEHFAESWPETKPYYE